MSVLHHLSEKREVLAQKLDTKPPTSFYDYDDLNAAFDEETLNMNPFGSIQL